jgi:hypothetical protein
MLQRASAIAALLWLPQAGKVVATNPTCYALIGGLDENGIFVSSQFAGADHTRRISWDVCQDARCPLRPIAKREVEVVANAGDLEARSRSSPHVHVQA